jgi:hypothetical protein
MKTAAKHDLVRVQLRIHVQQNGLVSRNVLIVPARPRKAT